MQALILCDEPLGNEPGAGQHIGKNFPSFSNLYNLCLYCATINDATIPWIQNPIGIWADVIKRHFQEDSGKILEATRRWMNALTMDTFQKSAQQIIDPRYHITYDRRCLPKFVQELEIVLKRYS